jgi:hypothetical protein
MRGAQAAHHHVVNGRGFAKRSTYAPEQVTGFLFLRYLRRAFTPRVEVPPGYWITVVIQNGNQVQVKFGAQYE